MCSDRIAYENDYEEEEEQTGKGRFHEESVVVVQLGHGELIYGFNLILGMLTSVYTIIFMVLHVFV